MRSESPTAGCDTHRIAGQDLDVQNDFTRFRARLDALWELLQDSLWQFALIASVLWISMVA